MNLWLAYACVLQTLVFVAAAGTLVGRPFKRLVMLQLANVLQILSMICLAEGFDRDIYFVLPLVLLFTSFVGNIAYVRLLERWA